MTIDELIAICEREIKRVKPMNRCPEFDCGYRVAYEQCLELAKEVKLTMMLEQAGIKND